MKNLAEYIDESILSADPDEAPLSREDILKIANTVTKKKFFKMEIVENDCDRHGARFLRQHSSDNEIVIQWFNGNFYLQMSVWDNKELGRPQYNFEGITYHNYVRPRARCGWYAHGGNKKCLLKYADLVENHITEILNCWAKAAIPLAAVDDMKLSKAKSQSICKKYFPDTWNGSSWE